MYNFNSSLFVYKFVYLIQIIGGIAAFSFFLDKKRKFPLRMIAFIVISFAICAALPQLENAPAYISGVFILLLFVCFGLMFMCFKEGWQTFLYIVLNIYSLQHVSYQLGLLISTTAGLSKKSVYENLPFSVGDMYPIMISLGFYVLFLSAMLIFVTKQKIKNKFDPSIKNIKMLIVGVSLIVINITLNSFITKDLIENFSLNKLVYTVIYDVVCSFCVIGLLFFSSVNQRLSEEIKEVNIIRQKDKEIYLIKKENNEAMSILCHDLKNRINAMQQDNDELERVKSTLETYQNTFYTNNVTLDIIFSEYGLKCKDQEIAFICNVDGSLLSFMDEVDLYSLFDNALSNAFSAVKQVNVKEDRYILLNIHKKGKMTLINLENKYSQNLLISNGRITTTKSNKLVHGFGIKSMENIVSKYDGSINFDIKNNIFKLSIVFY